MRPICHKAHNPHGSCGFFTTLKHACEVGGGKLPVHRIQSSHVLLNEEMPTK